VQRCFVGVARAARTERGPPAATQLPPSVAT
jgi:hypothetical protein